MNNIPGTKYIQYHKDKQLFQITKRIKGSLKSLGYGKTLIIALMKRDWCKTHNWKPYPKQSKTGEKYIVFEWNRFKVRKRIKGKYEYYGSFKTLEEAIKYRDFIVKKGWSTNHKYVNPMRHIYKNNEHSWSVSKLVDGKVTCFGTFKSVEEAQSERDLLEKYNWNYDLLCEHDTGEREYLTGKLNTKIHFKKYAARRDWY